MSPFKNFSMDKLLKQALIDEEVVKHLLDLDSEKKKKKHNRDFLITILGSLWPEFVWKVFEICPSFKGQRLV